MAASSTRIDSALARTSSKRSGGIGLEYVIEAEKGVAVRVPINFDVTLVAGVPDYYVTIAGLPTGAILSAGRLIYPGVWAIERNEIADLRLTMSDEALPATVVSITLVVRPGRETASLFGVSLHW